MARILYAEDDPSVATMIEFRLGDDGHDIVVARDGASARSLLSEQSFDLVLLDVMMPEVDGFALCRELASRPGRPAIIIVSGRDRMRDRATGIEAGADVYVVKPFDVDELARTIERLISARAVASG